MLGFRGVSQLASSVSDATAKSLEDVEGKANSIARFLADTTKGTVLQLNNNILFITKQFKDDFEKWNTLEEKIRGYEKKLNYGYLFFGLEEYPERVTELPLPVMAKLANWIHLYALVKLFDARTNPTENVTALDTNIRSRSTSYRPYDYSLCAVTLWLKEEFDRIVVESVKNAK